MSQLPPPTRAGWIKNSCLSVPLCLLVFACGWIRAEDTAEKPAAAPTFSKDIAPILQRHCQACHHPGANSPMSLVTYEEARPFVRAIRKAVGERTMPPWHADPRYGTFRNARVMSQEEIDKVVAWTQGGAPQGDPAGLPPPISPASEWQMGEPDLIVQLPEDNSVPAEIVDLTTLIDVPTNLTEDKWIEAAECIPDNRKIVHHFTVMPFASFIPGIQPFVYPPGHGVRLKAGTVLTFSMHYHKEKGVAARDRSRIGFRFARGPVRKHVYFGSIENQDFEIPPMNPDFAVRAEYTFERDHHILSLTPHMHERGKSMRATAIYPDGHETILLFVPKYSPEWQMTYVPAKPIPIPTGTRVVVDARFDNSAANPFNPDPSKKVLYARDMRSEEDFKNGDMAQLNIGATFDHEIIKEDGTILWPDTEAKPPF